MDTILDWKYKIANKKIITLDNSIDITTVSKFLRVKSQR